MGSGLEMHTSVAETGEDRINRPRPVRPGPVFGIAPRLFYLEITTL